MALSVDWTISQCLALLMDQPGQLVFGLRSSQVWRFAGIPPSTLDYWARTRLIRPSYRRSEGKRIERWWSVRDAVTIRSIRFLRDRGASLPAIRRAIKTLEAMGEDLASSSVVWDGSDLVLIDGESAMSLTLHPDQLVHVGVIPVGLWHAEATGLTEPADLEEFARARRTRNALRRARAETPVSIGELFAEGH